MSQHHCISLQHRHEDWNSMDCKSHYILLQSTCNQQNKYQEHKKDENHFMLGINNKSAINSGTESRLSLLLIIVTAKTILDDCMCKCKSQ